MLRRRMFAYMVMMITGITCAYLFMEKARFFSCVAIMVSVALSIRSIDVEYVPDKTIKERQVLIAFLILGYLVFTFSFIRMNQDPVLMKDSGLEILKRNCIDEVTCVKGTVCSVSYKNDSYRILLKPENMKRAGKVELYFYKKLPVQRESDMLGTGITAYGKLRFPRGQENPGCFNYKTYLCSKGIKYLFNAKLIRVNEMSDDLYWNYRRKMYEIRETFLTCFRGETETFIRGVVFGDKSEMEESLLEEFNTNSTGHILAVSGLHIGFLFNLLRMFTQKKRTMPITFIIIAIVFLYGEMTGWSPSTQRAVLVLSLNLSAIYFGRSPDLLSSTSASAIIILITEPYQLVNAGFQLSYAALLGLCFLTETLTYYIGDTLASIVAVQFSVAPLIIFYYSSLNVLSMFVNIPVVFMTSVLVPVCIIALGITVIAGSLPVQISTVIINLSEMIIRCNRVLTFDSSFSFHMKGINAGVLAAYYVLIFFAGSEWLRIKLIRKKFDLITKALCCMIMPLIVLSCATYNCFTDDEIVFISVGQGDSVHVRSGETNILIDGGGSKDYNVGKNILKPYLLHNGADHVELAAVTHLHTDHFQGIIDLCEILPVETIAVPDMYRKTLTDKISDDLDVSVTLSAGDRVRIGPDTYIESIWPVGKYMQNTVASDENESNMVYIIHSCGTKTMVTGDLLESDELDMLEYYRNSDALKCDVLKIGHHGSKTSSSERFLDEVDPDIAVIQVGADNPYGHPHIQTIDRLKSRGITVYRTDTDGAVGLDIKDGIIKVDTMM